jgi:hypothetical protein
VREVLQLREEVGGERRPLASFMNGLPETAMRQDAMKQTGSLPNASLLRKLNVTRTPYLENISGKWY